jgi:hypothetical protein
MRQFEIARELFIGVRKWAGRGGRKKKKRKGRV